MFSEQTAIFALYNINSLISITEVESVYSAVRREYLHNTQMFRLYPIIITSRCLCLCRNLYRSIFLHATKFSILFDISRHNEIFQTVGKKWHKKNTAYSSNVCTHYLCKYRTRKIAVYVIFVNMNFLISLMHGSCWIYFWRELSSFFKRLFFYLHTSQSRALLSLCTS
jgi:hypothetical protein